jgi:hypothetical protein
VKARYVGVLWTLVLAILLGGCRPTRAAAPPAATAAPPTSSPQPTSESIPTPDAPAATPTPNAEAASAALAIMLPTVTPTPPLPPPALPAPWQRVSLRPGEPPNAVAAEGLDLHGYLRGVRSDLAERSGILLVDARLDDGFRADGLPVAHLNFSLWPALGEPLAAIQLAYLEREHFIVVTVSAPEAARAELEAALRDLYTSITAE